MRRCIRPQRGRPQSRACKGWIDSHAANAPRPAAGFTAEPAASVSPGRRIGDVALARRALPPAAETDLCPSATAPLEKASMRLGRSKLPRWPRSTHSTAASSLMAAYRPSSIIRRQRTPRASAFTRAGSPRATATSAPTSPACTGTPSGPMIGLRPPRRRMVIGTTTVTLVMPPSPPAAAWPPCRARGLRARPGLAGSPPRPR